MQLILIKMTNYPNFLTGGNTKIAWLQENAFPWHMPERTHVIFPIHKIDCVGVASYNPSPHTSIAHRIRINKRIHIQDLHSQDNLHAGNYI